MSKLFKNIVKFTIVLGMVIFADFFINSVSAVKAELFKPEITNDMENEESEIDIKNRPDYRGVEVIPPTSEELNRTWKEVLSRKTENDFGDMPVNSWNCIGPYGIRRSSSSELYSGRVLEIEVEGVPSTRVASASGGLWRFGGFYPIPMSDQVTSLVTGAFATNPGDANTVIIGTGEPNGSGGNGTGLWRTVNNGLSWTNPTLTPIPGCFYKIRYQPGNNNMIHAAANTGYYRSDDGGLNWVRRTEGNITSLDIKSGNSNIIYIAKYGDGIYRSTNWGDNFSKLTSFPVASGADFGRAGISISVSNSNYVYISLPKQNGQTQGIYRTTNDGISWQNISFLPGGDYHWGQGNYNNCIAVSPTNPDMVLLGAGSLLRTTNGGTNWTQYMEGGAGVENLHNDHHVIRWHSDGTRVWLGNDGGMAYSDDAGLTWTVNSNFLPITQFYDFDIGVSGTNIVVAGGTQDNAFPVSLNCTINGSGVWNWGIFRDGSSSKIDKFNPLRIIGLTFNSSNWLDKTTNGGLTWGSAMTGLSSVCRISNIEDDGTNPVYCYLGHQGRIFTSTDFGSSWHTFTSEVFPDTVWNLRMSKFGAGGNIIYAVIDHGTDYLRVYDNGTWYNRSAGLPAALNCVSQHPSNNNIAYAVIFENLSSQRIFKTTNRGINWSNITGDLPAGVIVRDVVVNPQNDNILFAGTKFGMWKTTNGGVNWFRWTNGMPIANQIVRLRLIDSSSVSGRFYVAAASHGRGIWIREGSGDDPIGIHNQSSSIPDKYELFQNFPNPFNPTTKIGFSLPIKGLVEITVFDIAGREISTIIKQELFAGYHETEFDGSKFASGVYFYRIRSGDFSDVKKMILVK